jgi:hypothetical protein
MAKLIWVELHKRHEATAPNGNAYSIHSHWRGTPEHGSTTVILFVHIMTKVGTLGQPAAPAGWSRSFYVPTVEEGKRRAEMHANGERGWRKGIEEAGGVNYRRWHRDQS